MFLEFEFVALVVSQKNKLLSWIEKWEVLDDKFAEIYIVAETSSGILINHTDCSLAASSGMQSKSFRFQSIYALAKRKTNIARPQYVRGV